MKKLFKALYAWNTRREDFEELHIVLIAESSEEALKMLKDRYERCFTEYWDLREQEGQLVEISRKTG